MPSVGDTAALIIAEDGAIRDSLKALLEACGIVVNAYERIAGYLHERTATPDCCMLVTYQTTSTLGLEVVRALRDLGVVSPAIILSGKVYPMSAIHAEQLGATIIEAPSQIGALQNAIQAAL